VRARKGGVESKGEREGRKKARKGEAARRVEKSAQESQGKVGGFVMIATNGHEKRTVVWYGKCRFI